MIKILDSSKYLSTLVSDTTNGLGQIECVSCKVTEELNGIYELEAEVLSSEKHYDDLEVGGLLKVAVNETGDEQIFRIYRLTKPMGGKSVISAQHISYDLSKVAVIPFTSTGATATVSAMVSNMVGTYPFTMTTDIENTTSTFTLDIPRSFRECLGGYDGSILDVFGGEYEWDNLTVNLLSRRGADRDVRIAYGKNLTDFNQEENNANVYTSVLGYAVYNETTYTGEVYDKITSATPLVKIVDFSKYFTDTEPTTALLTTYAQEYAEENDIEIPSVNIQVDFVPLYQTEEFKDIAPLERVFLGDTVTVDFDKLGVSASARVIKTVWDVNLGRYDSVELGDAKANLNTVIESAVTSSKSIEQKTGEIASLMNDMASIIINGMGLHRTLVPDGSGGYKIYLHNQSTLAESNVQYVMTSEGLTVSTDYGATWNAGFDSSGNAVLNSLATITLKALNIYGGTITGSTFVFGDDEDAQVTASGNSSGMTFEGDGKINMKSTSAFNAYNYDSDGNTLNSLEMFAYSSTGLHRIDIKNYTSDNALGGSLILNNGASSSASTRSVDISVFGDESESLPVGSIFASYVPSTEKTYLYLTVSDVNGSSSTSVSSIMLDSDGKIYIKGDALYFNGTQKW